MEYTLTIDGKGVAGADAFPVLNPATEQVIAQCPSAGAAELERAIDSGRGAWRSWRREEQARRAALHEAAARLLGASDELARALTEEQGKPIREARAEVRMMSQWFEHYAALELPAEVVRSDDECEIEVRREPLGLVVAITPWNFPLALASWKLAPALRAGNVVVLKPSPLTPLSTLRVGELLRDVFPPGVLSVLAGPEPLGRQLTEQEGVDKVSFTGSIATGHAVAAEGAKHLRRDTLELGGNDAAILLDDADLDAIAPQLVFSAFTNCGQVCSAIKRVYAPRRLVREAAALIATASAAMRVGDGTERETRMGPLISAERREHVQELVRDALAGGAELLAGGPPRETGLGGRSGYFHAATVLLVEDPTARVVVEEQFGPVLPILAYDTVEQAIALANDSHFGLGGSVWGTDQARLRAVASELECGTVWLNSHVIVHPEQPFGGWKQSGAGLENGEAALSELTHMRTVYRAAGGRA